MDRAGFIRDVRSRAAFEDDAQADQMIAAVLGVVGTRLFENDARVVADQLPDDWAACVRGEGPQEEFDLDQLYRRVAAAREIELGRAVEQTQVICQVLTERVNEDARKHLRLRLPPPIADLFTPRPPPPPAPARLGAPAPPVSEEPPRTLAGGRPGSRRPLSEAKPPAGQTHSIAASDDPHADTKLATARGISTERHGRDLASGSDVSDRSLASRDED